MRNFLVRIVFSLLAGCFLLILISNFVKFADNTWCAISAGTLLALTYVGSGFLAIYLALNRFERLFIRFFVSSLAARFVLVMVVIILIIRFTGLEETSFLIAFFIWYFVFQMWEILSLNSMMKRKI